MSDPVPPALGAAVEVVAGRAGALGRSIVYFQEVGSTNDVADPLASQGASDGTLVVAGAQTQGRGRQGRQWFSPPSAGLYFSLVLRPDLAHHGGVTPLTTLAAGVAVAEGIERACGLTADLKWPNDLVAGTDRSRAGTSRRRKLAGILAEGSITGGRVQHVALGIGINVREGAFPPELADRATSLELELGREVPPFTVLAECLAAFAERWGQVRRGEWRPMLDAWRRRSPSAVGSLVAVQTGHGRATGRTSGLNDDGSLSVDVGGTEIRVVAGEVQWL
jgi:BirA family biotin operon repressor/biotin-[acetyl-CoA-carboxylase] ligase